jgi:VIT1/CCC1 family predicted Fe2+/Mn2+ transporter
VVHFALVEPQVVAILLAITLGTTVWKLGRSAWLGWTRLERLHRIVAEERWEIEHHRPQERDELRVLYEAKGFHGKLLEDVLDVLMADGDRLLRVMIEEELGLSLEVFEHPLKQGLGAAFGALSAGVAVTVATWLWPSYGIYIAVCAVIGSAAGVSAYLERNRIVPAMIWNLGIAALAFSAVYFLLDWFTSLGA